MKRRIMIMALMLLTVTGCATQGKTTSQNHYEQMAFRVADGTLWGSLTEANNLMQYWLDEGNTQHIDSFLHAFIDELLINPVTVHSFPDPMRHLLALERRVIDGRDKALAEKLDRLFATYFAKYDLDSMNARHLVILARSLARAGKSAEARKVLDLIEGPAWPGSPAEAQDLYGTGYFVRKMAETRYLLGDIPVTARLMALHEYTMPDQQPLLLDLGGREDMTRWDRDVARVRANIGKSTDTPSYGRSLDALTGEMISDTASHHLRNTIRALHYEGKPMQARLYLMTALQKLADRPLTPEDETGGYRVTTSYTHLMRVADLINCEPCFDALEELDDKEREGMAFSDTRRFNHDLHILSNLTVIGRTDRAIRYFGWLNEYVQTLPEDREDLLPGQWTRGDAVLNMCDTWTEYAPTNIYSMSRWIGMFNITNKTAIQRLREGCNYVPEILDEEG